MGKDRIESEPAFPKENLAGYGQTGMSKRFFAAVSILQGLITGIPTDNAGILKTKLVEQAYAIVDELLAQENK